MNKKNAWDALLSRFFILFNLTKPYERPSKNQENKNLFIQGEILPEKQTIMLGEVWGYTKTKVKVMQVYTGNNDADEIIEIYEPYYEGYYQGKKCLIVQEDYQPLKIGQTYNLHLSHERVRGKKTVRVNEPEQNYSPREENLFYQVS